MIAPLLIWMLLGAADLGRVYHAKTAIANAVRVGAEYGMDARRTNGDILGAVVNEAAPVVVISASKVSITRAASHWRTGTDLTVAVEYDFQAITPFISTVWGGGPLQLRASSTIRLVQ